MSVNWESCLSDFRSIAFAIEIVRQNLIYVQSTLTPMHKAGVDAKEGYAPTTMTQKTASNVWYISDD